MVMLGCWLSEDVAKCDRFGPVYGSLRACSDRGTTFVTRSCTSMVTMSLYFCWVEVTDGDESFWVPTVGKMVPL